MRLLWLAVLAGLALVTTASELDRASLGRPQLAILVPRPFRSYSQSPIALLALATGDPVTARTEARRLVRRRPVPAEHLFALALADLRGGQPVAFATAFRAASTRGWRYSPLQVTAAQSALAGGDVHGAANRVAALWAADAGNPATGPLTAALLAAPGGPEAFAAPLAGTRVWSGNFLATAAGLAPPPTIARTVNAARRLGARFDCDGLERLSDQLVAKAPGQAPIAFACER